VLETAQTGLALLSRANAVISRNICRDSKKRRNQTPQASCEASSAAILVQIEREVMSEDPEVEDERPCLHCLIGDLIDEYYGEYGSPSGEPDVIDVSEIMTSLAKIVAEITSGSDAAEGRRLVEELSREISKYDAEYREHAASGASGFDVRH
jgi:hypothetical protein